MNYDEALARIRELAFEAGLGIKTFCLVFLNCETVPEAVELVRKANP